ncbi:hypothetical protein GCM10010424_68320 [Streptomyces lienomycini]
MPAHLSWGTEDGGQSSVGFAANMESCYGHGRRPGRHVVELRGELDHQVRYARGAEGPGGYEFDTEVEDSGDRRPAGRLRFRIDDGGQTPLQWVSWGDDAGNGVSLTLRSTRPSGSADLGGLMGTVRASAEFRDAGEVAQNLVDPSPHKWFAPHDRAWLEFRLAEPVTVDRYVLTSANDAPDRDPAAWTLRGSADGHTWRTLDTRSGQSFAKRHQSRTYQAAVLGPCDRLRLDITGNNGSPHLQLEAVRFLADGSGGFVGLRRRAGQAPVTYHGVRRTSHPPHRGPARPASAGAPTTSPVMKQFATDRSSRTVRDL